MAKRGRGRPPKAAGERRDNRVVVKLTDDELAEWARQADARDQDMTVMVRDLVNSKFARTKTKRNNG